MRHQFKVVAVLLSFLAFSLFLFNVVEPVPGSPNDLSRLAGIISVARFNSLNIDKTPQVVTRDKAFCNGKFYSSKPPFLNWVSGVFIKGGFLCIKPELLNNDIPIYKTATFVNVTIPLVLISLLLCLIFSRTLPLIPACLLSMLLVFSSLLFSYAKYLNNHVPVAFFAFISFTLIFDKLVLDVFHKIRWLKWALIGVFLSLILAYDPPFMFLMGIVLVPYLLAKYRKKFREGVLVMLLFSLPIVLVHFYLTYKSFGILTIPQLYKETFFSYPGSHFSGVIDPTNINVYRPPFLILIFNNLFGTHGIFLYMPVLMFFFFHKKKKEAGWVFTLALLLVSVIAYSIFSPNFGGWSYGNRRLIPLIPLLYYFSVRYVIMSGKKILWGLFLILALISIFFSYLGFKNTWHNKRLHIKREFAYFPLLYNLNRDYFKVFSYDP